MAQYSHLPIYNKAFSILRELYQRVPKFGKQYKYFLGGKMIENSIEIIKLIIKANSERDKGKRKSPQQGRNLIRVFNMVNYFYDSKSKLFVKGKKHDKEL